MKYNIKISFELNTFKNNIDAYKLIKDIVSFKVNSFYDSLGIIAQYNNEIDIENHLLNHNDNTFILGGNIEDNDDFEKIIFKREHPIFNMENINISINVLENLDFDLLISKIHDSSFSTAYVTCNEKTRWQNEIFVNQFDVFKQPYTFVKRKPNFMSSSPDAGDMIDIFYNPGHERKVYGMQIMAAPEMWFGKKALEIFDKNDLLNFPNAIEINELENGIVHVKLFDFDEPDWQVPKILNLQKKFREWTKMNEIETFLREKIPNHAKMLN